MFPLFSTNNICTTISGLFHTSGLPFLIPIVAILVWGILSLVKLFVRHRERMAMIERGMHPDMKEEYSEEPEDSPEK